MTVTSLLRESVCVCVGGGEYMCVSVRYLRFFYKYLPTETTILLVNGHPT